MGTLIHILREANHAGVRVEDDVEESCLVKKTGASENDNEITTWVEYRFPDSEVIVHRSVHVTLKQWPDGMGVVAAELG